MRSYQSSPTSPVQRLGLDWTGLVDWYHFLRTAAAVVCTPVRCDYGKSRGRESRERNEDEIEEKC
jgi:hypothetical protein